MGGDVALEGAQIRHLGSGKADAPNDGRRPLLALLAHAFLNTEKPDLTTEDQRATQMEILGVNFAYVLLVCLWPILLLVLLLLGDAVVQSRALRDLKKKLAHLRRGLQGWAAKRPL